MVQTASDVWTYIEDETERRKKLLSDEILRAVIERVCREGREGTGGRFNRDIRHVRTALARISPPPPACPHGAPGPRPRLPLSAQSKPRSQKKRVIKPWLSQGSEVEIADAVVITTNRRREPPLQVRGGRG